MAINGFTVQCFQARKKATNMLAKLVKMDQATCLLRKGAYRRPSITTVACIFCGPVFPAGPSSYIDVHPRKLTPRPREKWRLEDYFPVTWKRSQGTWKNSWRNGCWSDPNRIHLNLNPATFQVASVPGTELQVRCANSILESYDRHIS